MESGPGKRGGDWPGDTRERTQDAAFVGRGDVGTEYLTEEEEEVFEEADWEFQGDVDEEEDGEDKWIVLKGGRILHE